MTSSQIYATEFSVKFYVLCVISEHDFVHWGFLKMMLHNCVILPKNLHKIVLDTNHHVLKMHPINIYLDTTPVPQVQGTLCFEGIHHKQH